MAIALLTANEVASLIQPEKLKAQGFVPPKRVLVSDGTDHSGDPAFYVYLVYTDDTSDAALAWAKVKAMVRWVRDTIRDASAEERWAYVRVSRESDLPASVR